MKMPIPAKAASDRQINRLRVGGSLGPSPRLWRSTRKATLAIEPTLKSSRWRCSTWKFSTSPGAFRTLTERARGRDR
jgi:hypothetical protein